MGTSTAGEREAPADLTGLARADLSSWFNPFLAQFVEDAYRCGGRVAVTRDDGEVIALQLLDPVERVGTILTRSRALAGAAYQSRGPTGLFAEFSLGPVAEGLDVFATGRELHPPTHRFRHPIRPYEPSDRQSVVDLVREVQGPFNEKWFDGLPTREHAGFVVEVEGRIVGVAWASRAGGEVRLHSLTVRPPFRRLGIGTDLLMARLLWAEQVGAARALSEISQRNLASAAVARRGGMHPIGTMYFHRPA